MLPLESLQNTLSRCKRLKRFTVMGGESTLLPNLDEYIRALKQKADVGCLVTNGTLLTEESLTKYAEAGLDEIAISISSLAQYERRKEQILAANRIIPNCRVNIPKSWESVGDKLYYLVDKVLSDGVGVVVCEDLMGRYGTYDFEGAMGAKVVRTDGHNFLTYEYKGMEFGLFAYYKGYDKTDLIITPIGNFASWEKYCQAIGNHSLSEVK
jgi:hypothetical protein